jgi:hypothetical protein
VALGGSSAALRSRPYRARDSCGFATQGSASLHPGLSHAAPLGLRNVAVAPGGRAATSGGLGDASHCLSPERVAFPASSQPGGPPLQGSDPERFPRSQGVALGSRRAPLRGSGSGGDVFPGWSEAQPWGYGPTTIPSPERAASQVEIIWCGQNVDTYRTMVSGEFVRFGRRPAAHPDLRGLGPWRPGKIVSRKCFGPTPREPPCR